MNNAANRTMNHSELVRLAAWGRVLGDETRLQLLMILLDGEQCVQDLACSLSMTSSAISHQLRELRLNELVKARREGKMTYYSCRNEQIREQILSFSTLVYMEQA